MLNLRTSPQAAATELLLRRRARRRLIDFTRYTYPGYKADPVHELIADTLDQVVEGKITRLIINAPPQHGKSLLTSEQLPAYWLGRRPDDPIIIASYAAAKAQGFSRKARDLVESKAYQAVFGDLARATRSALRQVRRDSRSVSEWHLAQPHRGKLVAVGVGGPITGHGALLGIVDDPIANWEEAQSPLMLERAWEWFRATFRPRIWEGGAIIVMMTRWNPNDPVGHILAEFPGEWTVLRLPAIAETQAERDSNDAYLGLPIGQPDPLGRTPGEALAPSRFSVPALHDLRRGTGSRAWAAEYQGVPRPAEGDRFKRSWFKIVAKGPPKDARRVRYWDKAGTEGGGKFTAGVLMVEWEGRYYVEHVVRGQWGAGRRERIIKATAERDRTRHDRVVTWQEKEPGSGGKESAENTKANLREEGIPIHNDPPVGNKDARMDGFEVEAENQNVFLVFGAWNGDWLDEICALPASVFRDQADATSGAFNKLKVKPKKAFTL